MNAVRELIRLATEGDGRKSTYDQALELGALICPEILGPDVSLIRRNRESDTAREYRQRAEAKTLKEGKQVEALELLDVEIAELESLFNTAKNQQKTDRLKRRLTELRRARGEIAPQRQTEHAIIFRDAYNVERDVPELGMGNACRDFLLSDGEVLRLRVFHPDNAEHVSGADVIYEKHHPKEQKASIAAIQYKIWEDRTLYLNDPRMKQQLLKLKSFFCDKNVCVAGHEDHPFRFPYCAGFLRPTDRLQMEDQKLASSGEHIPVCQIDRLKSEGVKGGECLTYNDVRRLSLSHEEFEGLFTTGKIGSKTLTYPELLDLYKGISGLTDPNRVLIHAQEFASPSEDQPSLFST
ncbi:hypothetical protein [Aeoliella mucimassa]|uniref:Uncharacterized protein n=1 Tax=Aeoliella mucimassa TaxID=2527972 RepID=A0A518AHQ9_9BACT|nr:hypothetical protein [Aeoliella mucimassa]QDU54271.1 hypothetical protein Pan181_04520 [Aeoliella mucimassa]